MARPKIENPKNKIVTVRLTEAEYETLLEVQSRTGDEFSEILRKALQFHNNYSKAISE
jgi:hypothetical protein